MAISAFFPELWSSRLQRHLDKALVYAQPAVVNRNYEGEISEYGDTVHIQNIADGGVDNYTPGSDITYDGTDVDIDTTLVIDQAKTWHVLVDDIHAKQAKVELLDNTVQRRAYVLADEIDQYIAGFSADVVTAGNVVEGGTPASAEAYEALVDLGVLLDEQNVPSEDRFAVIPPWFHGLLLTDDRFVGAGSMGTDVTLRNGQVGEAAGFNILKSNNVPEDEDEYSILAGSSQGITFAEQIRKVEALRHNKQFADIVRGLALYGGKLVNADELAVLTVTRGS